MTFVRPTSRPVRPVAVGVAILGVLALGLSACSSSGKSAAPAPAGTSAASVAGSSGAGTAGAVPSSLPSPVSLEFGVTAVSGADLSIYTAVAQGFFKKRGLNIKLDHLTPTVGIQALASGSIHLFSDGPTIVSSQLQKAKVKTIASYVTVIDYLYASQKSGIKSLTDLKGKTIASTTPGGTFDAFAREALQKAGLNPDKDVKFIYLGTADAILAALKAGTASVGIGNLATLEQAQKLGMVQVPVPDPTSLPAAKANFVGVDPSWGESNRPVVTQFLSAIKDGIAFDADPTNKTAVMKIITDTYKLSGDQAEQFYTATANTGNSDFAPDPAAVQSVLDLSKLPAAKTADPSTLVDDSYVKALSGS
jgi:NitT/TauT family transport system substrate-binding protein